MAPSIFHKIKMKQVTNDVEAFIFSIVRQTVKFREENNFSRNDVMQMLIELKNQGYISVDKNENNDEMKTESENINKLSMDQLAAQAFVFYVAGETYYLPIIFLLNL